MGDSYSSEPQDIAGYVLKTTPANAKGTFKGASQEVTYVYTNQVKVLVHYVDQDGKPIAGAPDQTISGIIGQPYPDNVVKDIPGYTLKSKPTGKFSSTETEVTYVYTNQVKVLAHYVDQDGKPIAEDETLSGKIGDDYPAKEIAGYVIKSKPSGKFSGTETEVTYVYTNQVKVLAHYVDQDGKPIADDDTLTGKIGNDYPDKTIAGFVIQTKPSGKFSGTETEVTYVYTNQVKVLAHYVDQNGKPVAEDETLSGKIGDDYPAKEIAGYVIQTKPAGKFSGTETEVTYVYTNQVKVLAHYVDQDGKPVAADDTLTGKIGDDYPDKTIEGYVIQTKPAGKFSGTETEITYVYTNQVKVLAHYVDQDGKSIADDETLTGKIGDDYPAKEIAGYVIQTKPSGKFSATVTEVTYVYTNQVKVLAHYVDQDGKSIAADETLTGKIGDDYPAKEIAGYVIQTKPSGKFSGTETEVTYVYTNQVKVLAHYVDQDGKPIAADDTLTGKIGNDYPAKEIAGYVIQTKPSGKFSATVTEVTYVYTNQVKVLAHYVDQDGKSIAADETLTGKIGDDYPAKEIAGYVIQTKPSGKFSGTETEVTYVYTNQVKVLAHYVDQDGKPIAADDTLTGKIGDDYPAKEIAGYVIQTKPSGKFSATVTEVTYVYTNQVKVLAHYVDQDGKSIAADDTLTGKIGDDYPDKTIAGYVIQTKPSGKFSGTETEVTYIYAKLVTVIAHYVDQDGKPIAGVTDETLSGKIGDPYPDSAVKDIPGYTLKTKPSGKFSSTETEVTYIYAKLVTVIAHYVDQDGKPIAGVTDEQLTGAIGDPYPDSAVKAIPGYTLKTKPTGKFSGTETEVTYVYTKNASVNPGGTAGRQPIVGGSVTVHYQDETGRQLAPDQILTGNVGEGYLTQEVTLAGYKLIQRPANATGFYTAHPQSVTYIYTKNVIGQAVVRRTVFHNSYLYDQNGGRKTGKYLMGKTIWTYGTKVIQGKKYYDLGQDSYVKATNVSGVKRKLRRNSYIYSKTAKKLQRKALKRGQK
ncbi:MucBP domain-containing protein [Lactobacillus sp. R2/2]|nr:MucBP domain-containing protein [Lactobacillus sp. R2/2]